MDTQAQLKNADKLLKLDHTNTEPLCEKQNLLGDATGETRAKLDTLKVVGDQANVALANGDITQAQYDALHRKTVEATEELCGLEGQTIISLPSSRRLPLRASI